MVSTMMMIIRMMISMEMQR